MTKKPNEDPTDWEKRKLNMYRQASREATHEVLESFGFTHDDIEEIQRDMAFIRRLRITSEAAGVKTVTSAIAFIFALGGAGLTLLFQQLAGR